MKIRMIYLVMAFIFALNTFVLSAVAVGEEVFMVEFKKSLRPRVMKKIVNDPGIVSIELFDDFESDYFKRLYKVKALSKSHLDFKGMPVKKIERVFEIESFSSENPVKREKRRRGLFLPEQWALFNDGQSLWQETDDINSIEVKGRPGYDIGLSNIYQNLSKKFKKNIVVAVLDSGISLDHIDLKESIYKNVVECNENLEIKHRPKEDLDKNGYNGDCMGWDFTTKGAGSNRPIDYKGHGTHLAGIIAAQRNERSGMTGVAPMIKILPVKVLKSKESKGAVIGLSDRIAKGLLYAIKMNVDVINFSMGWPRAMDTEYMRNAIKEAVDRGIIVVAAGGNNSTNRPIYPCSYDDVLCVGAMTNDGTFSSFSNFGAMVDLMAPGDQILSTVISEENYDYKNGTSQAAPFVSAAVGILKGLNPDLNKDDIVARLINGATPVAKSEKTKFSLAGLINIEKSLALSAPKFLYPNLKDIHIVNMKRGSKEFTFKIPLTAMGDDIKQVKVKLSFNDKNILTSFKTKKISRIKKDQTFLLNIRGKVRSLEGNAEGFFLLSLEYLGQVKTYKKEFILARSHFNHPKLVVKKVAKSLANYKLMKTVNGRLIPLIKTVKDKYRIYKTPEYFINLSGDEGNQLALLRTNREQVSLVKTKLPHVTRILGVYKFDLNYDGTPDYLVRSLATDNESEEGQKKYILYSYLDSFLRPLFGAHGHFKFYPEVVVMQPDKMNFIPMDSSVGPIAAPLFVGDGGIPKADLNPDPFEEEDLSKKKRLYYFEFDLSKDELKTRAIDQYQFIADTQKNLNLLWFHKINLIGLLSQSQEMFEKGVAKVHLAIGDGFNKEIYELKIEKNAKYSLLKLKSDLNLEGYFGIPVTHIKGGKASYFKSSAYSTLQSETQANFVFLNDDDSTEIERELTYVHKRKKDHILGVMAAFKENGHQFVVMQSKSKVILNALSGGKLRTFTKNIHRSSFLPGTLFQEIFYPVVSGVGESSQFGFYIDATALHAGHIYLLRASENGLRAPIYNNIYIPQNCLSLNPVRYHQYESFALLCERDDGSVDFNYLPIE